MKSNAYILPIQYDLPTYLKLYIKNTHTFSFLELFSFLCFYLLLGCAIFLTSQVAGKKFLKKLHKFNLRNHNNEYLNISISLLNIFHIFHSTFSTCVKKSPII